jgi:glycosyltransferase involved in cell wall biosynthesis
MSFKSSINGKNILYISPFPHIGGGEISLLTILKNLDIKRFKLSLICYAEGLFVEKARKLGIDVIVFKRDSLFSNFSILWKLFRYIKKNNIHIVHVNCLDIRAGIAAWLARVPFVGHLRVVFPFTWRDRLFVQLSRKVIAVSNAVVNAFCKESSGYMSKFVVIPNAIEIPGDITPARLREEFGLSSDTKLVGAVGRIYTFKGYEYFIVSANIIKREIPNVAFFIIGGVTHEEAEMYLNNLKRSVSKLGLSDFFFFTDFREDILSVIAALDILVVPSIEIRKAGGRVTEGFGRVAIEAMAVGVPVVASNIGGLTEIVEDNVSGILVPPGNSNAIAEAALFILTDEVKAKALGEAGRKRVEDFFVIRQQADKIEKLYFKILAKRK